MTRDVAQAVPEPGEEPVVPVVLESVLNTSVVLPSDGVGVWRVPTETVGDEQLEVAREWLDEGERQQASSYVRAELRRAYVIAHVATRLVVGALSDTPPEKVVWGRHPCPGCGEPHGRPRAERSGIEFSLSHTPGQVLVAVADRPVGVDVERHPDDPVALAKLLHPDEYDEIAAAAHGTLDGGRATVRFTRAWSRTEAYLKGLGIGLGRDPHLDYLGTDDAAGRSLGAWRVRDVVVPDGYGAALAVLV
ncbi:4'-phosphopantetheinyl transferase superfamily protein [Nocardioides albidus]|uniref:4'-phosphopantetheinyl transferase superfamily protein n=1 Tax=Nocardioides albidus TaxID=1517589 RepID=A0A5C4VKU8_9ACTN|nr:4'-phosphopantetheinyl transferase superfamily protein [Nocardioides albidus]TNM36458.1 4'-phosphopantetheinyl transferase superfamily protein [Nocardioides albidus]